MDGKVIRSTLILVNAISRNYDGSLSESPQLGLLYIATLVRNNGYPVKILAGDDLFTSITTNISLTNGPVLLGFYTNSDNITEVKRLAYYSKMVMPSIRIVFGGPLANVDYERMISSKYLDFVAFGDGEYLTLELMAKMDRGELEFPEISGLVWKHPNGETVVNQPRSTFRDLDQLPIPDRSLYPLDRLGLRSQIVTSRGCGFRCTFCFESTNRKYRSHSPDRVIEEIRELKAQYGTRYFTFVDDVFTTDHKRVRELCERFLTEFKPHEDFFWYCESRVDTLAKFPDLVPLMQKAGLVRIQIGTESGSQAVIDAYRKQIKLSEIEEAVAQCVEAGVLSVFTNFIIGGALDTEETLAETRDFALKLLRLAPGRLEINTTFLSPYPGTDIALRPDAYRIRVLDDEFVTGLSDDYIFAETYDLSKEKILNIEREFMLEFRSAMFAQIPDLEIELLLEHLAMNKHGLRTRWSDLLRSDPILGCAGKLLMSHSYDRRSQADEGLLEDTLVPLRTFSLRDWRNGSYFWHLRRKHLTMNAYEFRLLELCGGKLTVAEIIDRAVQYWNGNVDRQQIARDVKAFLTQLSHEALLVFRQTYKLNPLLDHSKETDYASVQSA